MQRPERGRRLQRPRPTWGGAGGSHRHAAEAGYNMVVLMVAVTLLSVFVATALPVWTQQMKREREAELIFRGWQYAEAIRVFQQRHGRFPTRLQELIEVKPRSIRKLWEDPMTEGGEWGLVFQGGVAPDQQDRELGGGGLQQGRRPPGARREAGGGNRGAGPRPGGPGGSGSGEQERVGPIIGVHSRSDEDSIKILFDEDSYERWAFTVEKLSTQGVTGIGPEGVQRRPQSPTTPNMVGGRPVLPRTEWIGKPFPEGVGLDAPNAGPAAGRPLGGGNAPGAGPDGRPPNARPGRGGPGNRPDR